MCPEAWTTSSTRLSRNCSGEACSAANMRAKHCEKILVCRGRRTASSGEQDEGFPLAAQLVDGPLDLRAIEQAKSRGLNDCSRRIQTAWLLHQASRRGGAG